MEKVTANNKISMRDFAVPLWKDICVINNGCWKYRI